MQTSLPSPQMPLLKNKYTKLVIIIFIAVATLTALLLTIYFVTKAKDNKSSQTSNNESQDFVSLTVKSYPTNVCPDEIIYGQGLPIGVWNGVQHQVTDEEGINWLDNVCKSQIQSNNKPQKSSWQFVNEAWVYQDGVPPTCPNPLLSISPVNVNLATSILYPGQTRGQYKPHGGFRFDNSQSDQISVNLPISAKLVGGAKYTESGDVQFLLEFVSDCGIAIRFDHLYTLAGEFKTIGDSLPLNPPGDSRGTNLDGKEFAAGSLVATAVGLPGTNNVGVDFGVYDYRKRNQASQDPNYVAKYQSYSSSQAFYAVCWLDLLPGSDSSTAKSLPGGDSSAGKNSDYCK